MKRIIAAGIKRLIEFDNIKEMYAYIGKLRDAGTEHRCLDHKEMPDGKVRLLIITAYNVSPLIEN